MSLDNSGGFPEQYVLTDCNTRDKTKICYTGTGHITLMKCTLWEPKGSSGNISIIHELFDNPSYDIDGATSKLDIP